MSITAVTSTTGAYDVDPAQSPSAGGAASALSPAAQSSVSTEGDLMQQLRSLASSDPERFKKVAAEVADQLKQQATQAGDGKQGAFLTRLAGRFDQASQTGDVSDLQPKSQGGKGHPHHQAYAQGSQPAPGMGDLAQLIQQALQDTSSTAAATDPSATGASAAVTT